MKKLIFPVWVHHIIAGISQGFSYWFNKELRITRKEIACYLFASISFTFFHTLRYNLSLRTFILHSIFIFLILIFFIVVIFNKRFQ